MYICMKLFYIQLVRLISVLYYEPWTIDKIALNLSVSELEVRSVVHHTLEPAACPFSYKFLWFQFHRKW